MEKLKQSYEALSESESPYLCPHCMLSKQMKEIEDLKQLVKSLAENLTAAKNQILPSKANQAESPEQPGNATELSAGNTLETVVVGKSVRRILCPGDTLS